MFSGDGDLGEVKLFTSKKDSELFESYAELFAILKTTEKLERAYIRDAISADDYEPACQKLIGQFKTLWETIKDAVPDVQQFMAQHNMQCPMAAKRLIYIGMPATVEHRSRPSAQSNASVNVAETVQHFITAMDSLKLNMAAVDQIHPLINDLVATMQKVPSIPPNSPGLTKTKAWATKLYGMQASDELSEPDVRQLLFDLESAYNEFMAALPRGS